MTAKRSTKPVSGRAKPVKRPLAGDGLDGLDSVELAKLTLQRICRDESTPASARAQAARTLLELSGALRVASVISSSSASEMSAQELDARLAQLEPYTPI